MAPGPVAHFLGSLIGAQQASLYAGGCEIYNKSVEFNKPCFHATI